MICGTQDTSYKRLILSVNLQDDVCSGVLRSLIKSAPILPIDLTAWQAFKSFCLFVHDEAVESKLSVLCFFSTLSYSIEFILNDKVS